MQKTKKSSRGRSLLKLVRYTWEASPFTFILLVITSLFFSALGFLEIVTLESLFTTILDIAAGTPHKSIIRPMLLLSVILILSPVSGWTEFLTQGYFWRRSSGYMQSLYHAHISKMEFISFEDPEVFNKIKKASLGYEDAPDGIRVIVQALFLYIPFFVTTMVYLMSIKPMLVLIILLIFIPALITELVKVKDHYQLEDEAANLHRKTDYFKSCLVSKEYFKETLLGGSFHFFYCLFQGTSKDYSKVYTSMQKRLLKISSLMKLIHTVGYLGVLALLIYYLYNGEITIGLFSAIYYSISKITSMLKGIIEDIGEAMVGITNTLFFMELLDEPLSPRKDGPLPKACDITLKNINFSYPNTQRAAVQNVNLTIRQGESLAIVGENGSGKSTLAKLILGLYDPQFGQVEYGGRNISGITEAVKYYKSSAVFQDFIKYKLSARDNIRIGDIDAKDTTEQLLSQNELHILGPKIHLDTVLSREFDGQDLSGGEWQRIAIARGIYRPHDLIVLDEPTAAIDPIEEANIFKAFKALSDKATCVFVTHRLGSVQIADRIIVMENGKIVEMGTHQELMDKKELYYRQLSSQMEWYMR